MSDRLQDRRYRETNFDHEADEARRLGLPPFEHLPAPECLVAMRAQKAAEEAAAKAGGEA